VLFCDLVGFTARSDRADPEDVGAMLRPHHARLRAEIERLGGTLDKFIGDAVMALFGAPVALGPGRWRPRPAPCSSGPSRTAPDRPRWAMVPAAISSGCPRRSEAHGRVRRARDRHEHPDGRIAGEDDLARLFAPA
jgi:class 3 adenylate cyclase